MANRAGGGADARLVEGAFLAVLGERSIGDEREEKLKKREVFGAEFEEVSGDGE